MAATLNLNCKPYKFQLPHSKSASTRGSKFAGIRCLATASPVKSYTITLLPGDGIGPEVVSIAKNALLCVSSLEGFELKFKEMPMGGAALDLTGVPLPEETLSTAKESDAVLLGAIGGYKWDNNEKHLKPETGLLQLREGLKVFANLRPATVLPQVKRWCAQDDLIFVSVSKFSTDLKWSESIYLVETLNSSKAIKNSSLNRFSIISN